jgi:hypothetical protein
MWSSILALMWMLADSLRSVEVMASASVPAEALASSAKPDMKDSSSRSGHGVVSSRE